MNEKLFVNQAELYNIDSSRRGKIYTHKQITIKFQIFLFVLITIELFILFSFKIFRKPIGNLR